MDYRGILVPMMAAALLASSTISRAAGANDDQMHNPQVQQKQSDNPRMGEGMMGGGMMGMMNGMNACADMMDRGASTMSGRGMPQLPPGNEKLQLQMQAEMMQKMGEILSKYAAQVEDRRGAR